MVGIRPFKRAFCMIFCKHTIKSSFDGCNPVPTWAIWKPRRIQGGQWVGDNNQASWQLVSLDRLSKLEHAIHNHKLVVLSGIFSTVCRFVPTITVSNEGKRVKDTVSWLLLGSYCQCYFLLVGDDKQFKPVIKSDDSNNPFIKSQFI